MTESTYIPPTIGEWWAIADAIKAWTGYPVTVEGGGAACTYLRIVLPDGRIILFGDAWETWGGQVFANAQDEQEAEPIDALEIDTDIPTSCHDAVKDSERIAQAFKDAITDVCMAGNPAVLGRCGKSDCVCVPRVERIAEIEKGMETLEHAIAYLSEQVKSEIDPLDEALAIMDRAHHTLTVDIDGTI